MGAADKLGATGPVLLFAKLGKEKHRHSDSWLPLMPAVPVFLLANSTVKVDGA